MKTAGILHFIQEDKKARWNFSTRSSTKPPAMGKEHTIIVEYGGRQSALRTRAGGSYYVGRQRIMVPKPETGFGEKKRCTT